MNAKALQKTRVLRLLTELDASLSSTAIDVLKKEAIDDLVEVAKNVVYGTFFLTPEEVIRLRRFKKDLRILTLKNTSYSKRQAILKKKGLLTTVAGSVFKE
jgi:hypothetical protein